MNSLTPFIRHEMDEQPGASSAPENSCSRCSPPLGKEPEAPVILPPGDPTAPGTQVPPHIETPGQTPHPDTHSAHYAPGLFSTGQHTHSRHPAPDEDTAAVLELVDWREESPYG